MGSFRELLGRLEEAHDQELSQLREATSFASKPVLWFLRRKQFNEFNNFNHGVFGQFFNVAPGSNPPGTSSHSLGESQADVDSKQWIAGFF